MLLASLGAAPAVAQSRVELKVSSYETSVNEPISATLTISQFKNCGAPKWAASEDFSFEQLGGPSNQSYSSTVFENGRAHTEEAVTRVYQFEITPNKQGSLTVPALTIDVDGQPFSTTPIKVKVREAERDPPITAAITCDAQTLFVGQLATFKLVIEARAAVVGTQKTTASFMYSTLDRRGQGFGPFPPIRDQSQVEEYSRKLADGSSANYYRFTSVLPWVIDRTGGDLFNDVVIACFYPVKFGRNMFGELEVTSQRNLRIKPKIEMPHIQPLPVENQPRGFTGAVGRFRLTIATPNRNVRVGDPIELTIDVSGEGPLNTLPAPNLAEQAALTAGFRVPNEALAGTSVGDRRRFSQTIRAKRADVREIPPIEYPYFDPTTASYAVVRSNSIPLTVTAGEQLAAADVDIAAPQTSNAGQAVEAIDGLRGNQTDARLLLASTSTITMQGLAATLATPPALVLAGWAYAAFVRGRQGDPRRRRRQAALSNALRRIGDAEKSPAAAREIEAAIANYLADRLGEPPAKFTGAAGLALLRERGIGADLQAEMARITAQCEQAAYAGMSAGETRQLAELSRACLTRLERENL